MDPHLHTLWNELQYSGAVPWTKWFGATGEERDFFRNATPEILREVKTVFVYRNPLDQMVSHFKHTKSFPADVDLNDNERAQLNDLAKFMLQEGALDSYIKLYLTFHLMQTQNDNLLFVAYEDLMRDPGHNIQRIMQHLDIPYDPSTFNDALNLSAKQNMRALETKLKHGLLAVNNETLHISRHVRNGDIGVWQQYLEPETVQQVEDRLQTFGLSLSMFDLADTLDPKFAFLERRSKLRL